VSELSSDEAQNQSDSSSDSSQSFLSNDESKVMTMSPSRPNCINLTDNNNNSLTSNNDITLNDIKQSTELLMNSLDKVRTTLMNETTTTTPSNNKKTLIKEEIQIEGLYDQLNSLKPLKTNNFKSTIQMMPMLSSSSSLRTSTRECIKESSLPPSISSSSSSSTPSSTDSSPSSSIGQYQKLSIGNSPLYVSSRRSMPPGATVVSSAASLTASNMTCVSNSCNQQKQASSPSNKMTVRFNDVTNGWYPTSTSVTSPINNCGSFVTNTNYNR
jgi:hypothetical protein